MRFDSYNERNPKDKFNQYPSWILIPTNGHNDGVVILWDESENCLACFSQAFPHSGWMEYGSKIEKEHSPWEVSDRWQFIGEL